MLSYISIHILLVLNLPKKSLIPFTKPFLISFGVTLMITIRNIEFFGITYADLGRKVLLVLDYMTLLKLFIVNWLGDSLIRTLFGPFFTKNIWMMVPPWTLFQPKPTTLAPWKPFANFFPSFTTRVNGIFVMILLISSMTIGGERILKTLIKCQNLGKQYAPKKLWEVLGLNNFPSSTVPLFQNWLGIFYRLK